MPDEVKGIIFWIILILIFVGCNKVSNSNSSENSMSEYDPISIEVLVDDLQEIKDIANNRDRNYNEILDEISNKIDSIIEQDKTKYEVQQELNEEKRQDFINEQNF